MAVTVVELQQRPEHNDKLGVLGIFDAAKGRWLVTGPGKMMLKPANLRLAFAITTTPAQYAAGCRVSLQAEDIPMARLLATAARKACAKIRS